MTGKVKQGAILFAVAASFAAAATGAFANQQVLQDPLPGAAIPQFVDPVPVPQRISGPHLRIEMQEFQQKVLPSTMYPKDSPFADGTYLWGFKRSYPGPTLEQKRGRPVTVDWVNNIVGPFDYVATYPSDDTFQCKTAKDKNRKEKGDRKFGAPILQKYLTVDQTLHWADPPHLMCLFKTPVCSPTSTDPCCKPYGYPSWPGFPVPFPALPDQGQPVPAVVHLHGGEVPSAFDGHPEAWFTPDGEHGINYTSLFPGGTNNAVFRYPNGQEPTTLWYHDHALGMTRLSLFAGLAGFYLLRDDRDTGRPDNPIGLPAEKYELELLIQDRSFDSNGQLLFPDVGVNPTVHPFWIPEFFGDVNVVNGKSWPYMEVEQRRYRFRLLNGSNARFYNMKFSDGRTFWQIGTDGGFLDAPVPINELLLAPAERADVIVDFSGAPAGSRIIVTNDANAPFPDGDPVDPATNGRIMEFRVKKGANQDKTCNPAVKGSCQLREEPINRLTTYDEKRQLVLVENLSEIDEPLEVLLNNTKWSGFKESTLTDNPTPIADSKLIRNNWGTEFPQVGSTELWEVANLTDDAHPIHIHLVQFQIVNRQTFDDEAYHEIYDPAAPPGDGPPKPYETRNADDAIGGNFAFTPFLRDEPMPPAANENGWKDTVVMLPHQVTRIIARWAPQDVPPGKVKPGQNLYPFDPTLIEPCARDFAGNPAGPGYVWHCHILDHEDNEMMRPYSVSRERQVPPK